MLVFLLLVFVLGAATASPTAPSPTECSIVSNMCLQACANTVSLGSAESLVDSPAACVAWCEARSSTVCCAIELSTELQYSCTRYDAGPSEAPLLDGSMFGGYATCQPRTEAPTFAPTPLPTTPQPTTSTPSSSAPTTAQPTSSSPTTSTPTTAQPTSSQPTSSRPTSSSPTANPTPNPTTAQPTSSQPTSSRPTSSSPSTSNPTTAQPTSSQPTSSSPTANPTAQPTTRQPTSSSPTSQPSSSPTTNAPTRAPTTRQPTPNPTTAQPTSSRPTFAPTSAPTQIPGCDATSIVDMSGSDVVISTYSGATTAERDASCCTQCGALFACQFWVRATDSDSCWLKTGFTGYGGADHRRGAFRVCEATSIVDMTGTDLEETTYDIDGNWLEQDTSCCAKCNAIPACLFWVRATDSNLCWLKTGFIGYGGSSHRRGAFRVCEATSSVDMSGTDLQMTTYEGSYALEQDTSCCAKCRANPACEFWVRATDSNFCWLKTSFTHYGGSSNRRGAFVV